MASISSFFGLLGFGFAPKNHLNGALELGGADFGGDFDLVEFLAARAQILARFGLDVGLGGFDAALELADFALEGMHALDRLVNLVDQALLFERG